MGYIKTKVDNPIDYETVKNIYGAIDVNGSLYVPLQVEITVIIIMVQLHKYLMRHYLTTLFRTTHHQ